MSEKEYKEKCESMFKKNTILINENEQLKEQNKIILEDNDTLNKWNDELREQIEKMKNVGNCKHSITCAEWNEKQLYLGTMKFCKNCKDWELAE